MGHGVRCVMMASTMMLLQLSVKCWDMSKIIIYLCPVFVITTTH